MNKIMFNAWVKAQMAKQSVKDYMKSEKGGADTIIIAVMIILVVVALAVIFRKQITGWFNDIMGKTSEEMSDFMGVGGTGES